MTPTAHPEITAAHVLGALAPTAPARAVIALDHADGAVLVCPITDTTNWRDRQIATVVATRAELEAALDTEERADTAALEALAEQLSRHARTLGRPQGAAAA